jgi:hypothetical protein
MPIVNPNPVVVPPTPEVVYPYIWLYNIMIHAPAIDTGRITIETLPYNADSQAIGGGDYIQTIQTDQLWKAVAEVPEVAAAMQAIIDAVEPLNNWINLQNQPPVVPEVIEEPIVEEPVIDN